MRIDAHQHFWHYDPREYGWIGEGMNVLKRDYLPDEYEPLLRRVGFDGSMVVQATQTEAETDWLLALAEGYPFVKGVVGWVDLQSESLRDTLERRRSQTRLRAIRHPIQDEPDGDFMLRPAFLRGIGLLAEFDLTYDLLIFPRHMAAACDLVAHFPNQRFVLDHLGKPPIQSGEIDPWREGLRRLARFPNVACKLSGLVTEADWHAWTPEQLRPYLDAVLEAFTPARLMIGSDWPVCTLSASYEQVIGLALEFVGQLSPTEQADLCGGTATRWYELSDA